MAPPSNGPRTWSASRLRAPLTCQSFRSRTPASADPDARLNQRSSEFAHLAIMMMDAASEGIAAWRTEPTLGDVGVRQRLRQQLAERHVADSCFLQRFLAPGSTYEGVVQCALQAPDAGAALAACCVIVLIFLDDLALTQTRASNDAPAEYATSKESKSAFIAALRSRVLTVINAMEADLETIWGTPLNAQGCIALARRIRTPASPMDTYVAQKPLTLALCELLRPLWNQLDSRKLAVEAAIAQSLASPRRRQPASEHAGPAAPTPRCSGQYSSFRPRPPAHPSSRTGADDAVGHRHSGESDGLQHQPWLFGISSLTAGVKRHDTLWRAFEPQLFGAQLLSAQNLTAAIEQGATVAALGVIPWPESILRGIALARGSTVAAEERLAIAAFLKQCQRRWHPDRFQSLALRVLGGPCEVADRLVARVTSIAQCVNELKDAFM